MQFLHMLDRPAADILAYLDASASVAAYVVRRAPSRKSAATRLYVRYGPNPWLNLNGGYLIAAVWTLFEAPAERAAAAITAALDLGEPDDLVVARTVARLGVGTPHLVVMTAAAREVELTTLAMRGMMARGEFGVFNRRWKIDHAAGKNPLSYSKHVNGLRLDLIRAAAKKRLAQAVAR